MPSHHNKIQLSVRASVPWHNQHAMCVNLTPENLEIHIFGYTSRENKMTVGI